MAKHIELKLDQAGLVLLDPGTTKLGNVIEKKADWKIKDQRIEAFRIEGKFARGYYPFKDPPNPNFGTDLELEVPWFKQTGDWEYKIIWIDKATQNEHTLDPKIAVNPVTGSLALIALTVVTLFSTIACLFYFNRKNRDRLKI
jgi:hypothetical protein